MTILNAITQSDSLMPNPFSEEQKIIWLSEIEGTILKEIYHKKDSEIITYEINTPPETELLCAAPYDGIYIQYLLCMYALYTDDIAAYNMHLILFNNLYNGINKKYCREQAASGQIYYGR